MSLDFNAFFGLLHDILFRDFSPGLTSLSQSAASSLVTAVWQGMVVALGLTLAFRFAPRATATLRFLMWAAGFLVVLGLPFLPILVAAEHHPTESTLVSTQTQSWLTFDHRWSIVLTAIWLATSLLRGINLAAHSVRLRNIWKTARAVQFPAGNAQLFAIPGRGRVELCASDSVERPSVIGFLSPRILIPDWLLEQLDPAELNQVILHEAEHLRRWDDWTNLLQKLLLVIFPLNPALFWIERRLCLEREIACDEGVVRRTNAPRAYAACLASLAERGLQHRNQTLSSGALSLGAWHRRPELTRRVQTVLLHKKSLGALGAGSLFAALSCSLAVATLELARCPQLVAFAPRLAQSAAQSGIGTAPYTPGRSKPYNDQFPALQNVSLQTHSIAAAPSGKQPHAIRQRNPRVSVSIEQPPTGDRIPTSGESSSMLQAELLDQPTAASAQQQEWIVLTSWEQITPADEPTLQAHQAKQDIPGGQQYPTERRGQITVTRLIFRVLSNTPSPANAPTRDGWLVFQL